jgi:hypothetical protein
MFDRVAPRTAEGAERANVAGVKALHGADWALRLPADESPEVVYDPKRALIVIREDEVALLPPDYAPRIHAFVDAVAAAGYSPVLLPFAPEDERFATAIGLDDKLPTERQWWNPRRLKQVICSSGITLSIGRLHPIIFAATGDRPVAAATPPHWEGVNDGMHKIEVMGSELGIACYGSVEQLAVAVAEGSVRPADPWLVNEAQRRLDFVLDSLHGLFRRR